MVEVTGKLLPLARSFSRQIVPPVLATLIAALLIAGFNRAFSSHLVQPRMAALHHAQGETRPIVYAANPQQEVAVTEVATSGPTVPERIFAKDNVREAGKDQGTLKVAAAPAAPTPVPTPAPAPRVTRKSEPAIEQRVASVPVVVAPAPAPIAPAPVIVAPSAQPVAPHYGAPVTQAPIAAPLPPVATAQPALPPQRLAPQYGAPVTQAPIGAPLPPVAAAQPVAPEPPPVITAKPMVTVPDRPRAAPYPGYEPRAPYDQQAQQSDDAAPPRADRPLERFVDAIKPSSIFNRMREFGDRIEAAGNEILPSIRQ
jgi:hypothetical protein